MLVRSFPSGVSSWPLRAWGEQGVAVAVVRAVEAQASHCVAWELPNEVESVIVSVYTHIGFGLPDVQAFCFFLFISSHRCLYYSLCFL